MEQNVFFATADDARRFIRDGLGDAGTDADVHRIWTTARARDAIVYVEPHGFQFVGGLDGFDPLDHLVTLLDSPEARALEAWILENDLVNQRGPLGDAIMSAWLAEADSGQGIVEIPARWSVTGAPVTFNVWEAA